MCGPRVVGASGSYFYFTPDRKYIVKTISKAPCEHVLYPKDTCMQGHASCLWHCLASRSTHHRSMDPGPLLFAVLFPAALSLSSMPSVQCLAGCSQGEKRNLLHVAESLREHVKGNPQSMIHYYALHSIRLPLNTKKVCSSVYSTLW